MLQFDLMKTAFRVGDTVQVHQKIIEKEKVAGKTKREVKEEQKERIQIFEGVVIAIKNREENKTFTVRKISLDNVGVERIYPIDSPWIVKIVVKRKGDIRRAKLYYLRHLTGKKAKKIESGELVKEEIVKKTEEPKKTEEVEVVEKKEDQKEEVVTETPKEAENETELKEEKPEEPKK
jgi:large subunit ribosomal protein L19